MIIIRPVGEPFVILLLHSGTNRFSVYSYFFMHRFLADVTVTLAVVAAYHRTGRKADRIADLRFRSYWDCPLPAGADNLPYLTGDKIQRVSLWDTGSGCVDSSGYWGECSSIEKNPSLYSYNGMRVQNKF